MAKISKNVIKGKAGGKAGAAQQAATKRINMMETLKMLQGGNTTEAIAVKLGVSLSTAQTYRRELMRSGKWEPTNFRLRAVRINFMQANIGQPLDWFVEKTGMAKSTLARDLKKLGRTDIKLNKYVTGKQSPIGSNEMLAREFRDCYKWNAVHRAMTTRKEMRV